jgi:hypothetical protein
MSGAEHAVPTKTTLQLMEIPSTNHTQNWWVMQTEYFEVPECFWGPNGWRDGKDDGKEEGFGTSNILQTIFQKAVKIKQKIRLS